MAEDDTYSAPEAAKVLRLSERRIQQMLQSGELPGTKLDSGYWRIPKHAVHNRKDETKSTRTKRRSAAFEDSRRSAALENDLRALEREIGRLEGRLELTAKAESTLQAERDRLAADLDHEREQARLERERADKLAADLEAERSKGFWARLFGG